jgi:hypothetical protein
LRNDPELKTLSAEAMVAFMVNSIPDEVSSILLERHIHDHAKVVAVQSSGGTTQEPKLVPPSKEDARRLSIKSFRTQYRRELDQLIHRVLETPLGTMLLLVMRRGIVRQRSKSLTSTAVGQVLAGTSLSTASEQLNSCEKLCHSHSGCRYCSPTESPKGSAEDLFSVQPTPSDPKTPAFLTMLLLAFPVEHMLPANIHEVNASAYDAMLSLWDLTKAPLLVKREITRLRTQVCALQQVWHDEQVSESVNEPDNLAGLNFPLCGCRACDSIDALFFEGIATPTGTS